MPAFGARKEKLARPRDKEVLAVAEAGSQCTPNGKWQAEEGNSHRKRDSDVDTGWEAEAEVVQCCPLVAAGHTQSWPAVLRMKWVEGGSAFQRKVREDVDSTARTHDVVEECALDWVVPTRDVSNMGVVRILGGVHACTLVTPWDRESRQECCSAREQSSQGTFPSLV